MAETKTNGQGIHHLKGWPESFHAVERGNKAFEIRKNDRGFRVGDLVVLHEWDPILGRGRSAEGYLGRSREGIITHISTPESIAAHSPGALGDGYVILSVEWRF